jgi:hypothetical protein
MDKRSVTRRKALKGMVNKVNAGDPTANPRKLSSNSVMCWRCFSRDPLSASFIEENS